LAYIFSYRVLKNGLAAFITGALFAVHPINTEAIAYVAGRADPLYLIFFFVSCIFFMKATEPIPSGERMRFAPYALSLVFFAFSLLSKEIAIILPCILLLYIFSFYTYGEFKKKLYALCIPFGVITIIYAVARKTVLDFSHLIPSSTMGSVNILLRLLTTFKVIFVYVRLLILPYGLHMEREIDIAHGIFELPVLGALVFVILLYVTVVYFYSFSRKLFFGGALFFVALLPVSNIVPINSFIAEHWLYLPAVGFYMTAAIGISHILSRVRDRPQNRRWSALVILCIILLIAYYSSLTIGRNKDWRDEVSFFESTLEYRQDNARLHLNFGNTYYEREDFDNALKEYIRAVTIRPDYAESYANIGSILIRKHKYDAAEKYIKRGLAIKPKMPFALYMLANIYMKKGDYAEAERYFKRSLDIMPGFLDCRLRLGQLYADHGDTEKALYQWRMAMEVNPNEERAKRLIYKYSKTKRGATN
jgi:tetratricopeptide (TPR) repeat protein